MYSASQGHPRGLYLLFATEMWERFSYYGNRALLALFMLGALAFDKQMASHLYGSYTALAYLTPLVGGYVADRYWGNRRSILVGGLLMAAGQFVLFWAGSVYYNAALAVPLFYAGLTLLAIGNGFFKPNISTMVGELYAQGDKRRDAGFTIFYMGINLGALMAGFVAGAVATKWGWQAGFVAAGIGMLFSLVIQAFFAQRYLGDIGKVSAAKRSAALRSSAQKTPLTKQVVDRIKVILVLGLFTIIFWAGFEQAGGLMNLYAQEYTDRMIGSFEVPTAWFQSLNPFFIITLAPIVAAIWIKLGSKEPNSPVKFAMGLLFLAVGFLFMIGAVLEQGGDQAVKTSMFWLVGAYLFHTLGELCLSPIGLSMVTKLAPLRLASLMMGAWFGFVALANYAAGFIGSFVGESGAMAIFGGIALAAVISALILLTMANRLVYWMHGAEGPAKEPEEQEQKLQSATV